MNKQQVLKMNKQQVLKMNHAFRTNIIVFLFFQINSLRLENF